MAEIGAPNVRDPKEWNECRWALAGAAALTAVGLVAGLGIGAFAWAERAFGPPALAAAAMAARVLWALRVVVKGLHEPETAREFACCYLAWLAGIVFAVAALAGGYALVDVLSGHGGAAP